MLLIKKQPITGVKTTKKNTTTITTGKELEEKRKNQGDRNGGDSLAERIRRQIAENREKIWKSY